MVEWSIIDIGTQTPLKYFIYFFKCFRYLHWCRINLQYVLACCAISLEISSTCERAASRPIKLYLREKRVYLLLSVRYEASVSASLHVSRIQIDYARLAWAMHSVCACGLLKRLSANGFSQILWIHGQRQLRPTPTNSDHKSLKRDNDDAKASSPKVRVQHFMRCPAIILWAENKRRFRHQLSIKIYHNHNDDGRFESPPQSAPLHGPATPFGEITVIKFALCVGRTWWLDTAVAARRHICLHIVGLHGRATCK